jgi:hypothetical protein
MLCVLPSLVIRSEAGWIIPAPLGLLMHCIMVVYLGYSIFGHTILQLCIEVASMYFIHDTRSRDKSCGLEVHRSSSVATGGN